MSDKLYFTPITGYGLARVGLAPAYDNWNNRWQGRNVACAHFDPQSGTTRSEPQPMTLSEELVIGRALSIISNPGAIADLPANLARYVTSGAWDLGTVESPLKTICDACRRAAEDGQSR